MRAGLASRIEPRLVGGFEYWRLGWLQAGFSSFAYRLAHLRASRFLVLTSLSVAFLIA
jgi:hypothetical protein